MYIDKDYEDQKFEDIKLTEADIENCRFYDCTFEACTFEECTLQNCIFSECAFYNCNVISLKAVSTQMKHSEFYNCNLIGIRWHELLPAGKIMEPIRKLKECFLNYNSFIHMSFRKFDFSGNGIQNSSFDECRLMESKFQNCRLEATQFSRCDMRKADFRDAAGYQIDITTNKLKEARFSFPEVVNLLKVLDIKID